MSNLVVVAIPDENDRVWKVSSEKIPHLTLLFLSETGQTANLDKIVGFVEHASSMLNRFYLQVDRRGELGADQADVLFFKKDRYSYKAVRDFRASLLQDHNIRTAYDTVSQFEGPWNPHLTLGYPTAPPKPENNDWGGFYSVDFNKIAVWTGDYEGPEFQLKDHWDEYDALEAVPMDVAMSSLNQVRVGAGMEALEHFGVKGMRWGVRNDGNGGGGGGVGRAVGKAARGTTTVLKDVHFETRTATTDLKGDKKTSTAHGLIIDKAHKGWKDEDLPALKERHPNASFKKRLTKPLSRDARAYRKDARDTYINRLEATANSMKNASGTREYTIRERGGDLPTSRYFWEVSSRHARHAAGDDFTLLEVAMDEDGYITGLNEVQSSMAQTVELGAEFLEHYGVKGQKWGVRKDPRTGLTPGEHRREGIQRYLDPQGHAISTDVAKFGVGILVPVVAPLTWPAQIRLIRGGARGVQKKVVDSQEKRFVKNAMSPKNFVAIHNGAVDKMNRDLDPINAKYPKPNQDAKTRKKYDDEVLASMQNAYRESANAIGNRAGTHHLDVEFRNDGLDFTIHARQGAPTSQPKRVKHAAEDVVDEEITVEITGKIKRDAAGHIVGFDFDHLDASSAQHVADIGATLVSALLDGATLEHYGVKGMRWGVRSHRELSTQSHIDTGLVRRRTQVVAKGGESHPAHDDAIKAAVNRQKLKRSGTAALSNQELRELANRIQLENQVAILTSSKGKRFVQQQLEQQTKEEFKKGVGRAAPHVVRKVRRGAAVGAAAAALA